MILVLFNLRNSKLQDFQMKKSNQKIILLEITYSFEIKLI